MTHEVSVQEPARTLAWSEIPFTRLIGLEREYSHGGRARFVLAPKPELCNMVHATHGGVVATLLDVAMASAAVSARPAMTAVTLSMSCQFLRPGRGRLSVDGELVADDDGDALCRARVFDADGALVAQAQGSFRYLPRR